MRLNETLSIIESVLSNPLELATVIVVLLYLRFCFFVANYQKKPTKIKIQKTQATPETTEKEENAKDKKQEEDNDDDDEDEHEDEKTK